MVRASTLPLRLLALSYGATQVYSEELIDRSLIACDRVLNESLGTIDYVKRRKLSKKDLRKIESGAKPKNQDVVVFRTHRKLEEGKLVLQLGTSSPDLAAHAARKVLGDVDGIDVNMGCPKKFSIQGGMGAALLSDIGRAKSIIEAIKKEVEGRVPVSAKIRLVGGEDATEDELFENTSGFMRELVKSGVDLIAVHGRTKFDSSHDLKARPRWGTMRRLVEAVDVPVIINGDIYSYEDAEEVRRLTGCRGVMLARGALMNTSIFRREGMVGLREVVKEYIELCGRWGNHFINTKYVVCEFLTGRRHPHELGIKVEKVGREVKDVCECKGMEGLRKLFGVVGGEEEVEAEGALEKSYSDDYFKEEGGGGKRRKVGEDNRVL
jgi:tRNA-dihydrouridine synthase 2